MTTYCFRLISLLAALGTATAFVVRDASGSSSSFFRLWYIDDEANHKVSDTMGFPSLTSPYIPLMMDTTTDLIIRQQYEAWRCKYDKPADESRYLIFKEHFLEQQAWNERNGDWSHELNEYGDLTNAEYLQIILQGGPEGGVVPPPSTTTTSNGQGFDDQGFEPQHRTLGAITAAAAAAAAPHENQYLTGLEKKRKWLPIKEATENVILLGESVVQHLHQMWDDWVDHVRQNLPF